MASLLLAVVEALL